LGFVGPDQPWSEETAGKEIVPASKECYQGWQHRWNFAGNTPAVQGVVPQKALDPGKPPMVAGYGKTAARAKNPAPGVNGVTAKIRDYKFRDCFPTGRIDEAWKPGKGRHEWWCCPPVPEIKPKRAVTAAELDVYGEDVCQSFYHEGEVYLGEPRWLDNNFLIPTGWDLRETDIIDKGYRLFCYAEKPEDYYKNLAVAGSMQAVTVAVDQAQQLIEKQEREAREEAVVQAAEAEFDYNFFERYGLYMAIGAGVIGLGLVAGLIKRSLS
jgi:hypothetical protein